MLRIGEIEHGRRRAAFRTFEAGALVREVHDLMEPLAEEKGVAFALGVGDEVLDITGDRELILEALVNLVDNAIKFTPAGRPLPVERLAEPRTGSACGSRTADPAFPKRSARR